MGDGSQVIHYLIEFSSGGGEFKCGMKVDFRESWDIRPRWTVFPTHATCPVCKELYEWERIRESENWQRWLKQGVQRIVDSGEAT